MGGGWRLKSSVEWGRLMAGKSRDEIVERLK